MRLFGVVELLVAPTADVLEGLTGLETVLVTALLFASSVVEVHTNLVIAHVFLRDTIDVLLSLGGRRFGLAATVVVVFLPVRESVVLRNLLKSRPDTLEAGLDHGPVGPLELFHHPRHHHFMTSIENLLVRVVERHLNKKLSELDFIRQSCVETRGRRFGQDLRQHAINELMKSQVFVCSDIMSGDPWLEHLVRPTDLSEHKSSTDLVGSRRHDFPEFCHVYSHKVTLDFKHWAHVYPEASSDFGVLNTVS